MDVIEYIKQNYHNLNSRDYRFLGSLIQLLDKKQLAELKEWLIKKQYYINRLVVEIDKILIPKIYKPNETIGELIKLFNNKKSKHVQEARNKLKLRYNYQSGVTQQKILKAFLHATKADRKWALRILKDEWHHSLLGDVRELWEEHHDEEGTIVVIKHFPESYLLEHQGELSEKWNYKHLCFRLANNPRFHIDKAHFDSYDNKWDYLYVMAETGGKISGEEAERILYQVIAKSLIKSFAEYYSDRLRTYLNAIWYDFENSVSMMLNPQVNRVAWCIGKLKLADELWRFRKWDEMIRMEFCHKYPGRAVECFQNYQLAWYAYLDVAKTHFPTKYAGLLAEVDTERLTNREWYRILTPEEAVEWDKAKQSAIPEKILGSERPLTDKTTQEGILQKMLDKNPVMANLIESFNLTPDNDDLPF